MALWLKDGKLIADGNGRPVDCTECPCGEGDCDDQLRRTADRLLHEKDPDTGEYVWQHVGTWQSSFRCASWTYDQTSGAWILNHPSSGTLVAAVRHGVAPDVSYDALPLISAQVFYHRTGGYYRTIGCACSTDAATYSCRAVFVSYTGYDVVGTVPVYQPPENSDSGSESSPPEYFLEDACRFDRCGLLKAWLAKLQAWYGGELRGEGFIDWWDGGVRPWMEWEAMEYYRFSPHLMAWLYPTENGSYLVRIPCPCENFSTGWLSGGQMLHAMEGVCDDDLGECQRTVMMYARWYLDLGASGEPLEASDSGERLWTEVGSYVASYTCAEWEYDEETGEYSKIKPPSGNLIMAYDVSRSIEWGTMSFFASYGKLTVATVLRNTQTGAWKTLGCQCRYGQYDHACTPQFVNLDSYKVCGTLPVVASEESDCAVDECEAAKMCLNCLAAEKGGTLHGEGYIEDTGNGYSYTKHLAAYEFSDISPFTQEPTTVAIWIPCSCGTYMSVTELTGSRHIRALSGICTQDCPDYFALRASAQANGWTWHNEGFLIHKASCQYYDSGEGEYHHAVGDWFMPSSYATGRASAWASDRVYILSCDCDNTHSAGYYISSVSLSGWGDSDIGPADESPAPQGYWEWMDYDGACDCIDWREMILEYPDKFGVEEISYGNHTKYHYVYTWTETDPVTFEEITHTQDYYEIVGNYSWRTCDNGGDMYLDYRTLCWIQKAYQNVDGTCAIRYCVRSISPKDSPEKPYDREYNVSYYDNLDFAGHAQPFAEDPDTHWLWSGRYRWWLGWCGCTPHGFDTQGEAQSYASQAVYCDDACSYNCNGGDPIVPRLSPPDTSYSLVCSSAVWKDDTYEMWWGRPDTYRRGRPYGTGDATTWYREQWIQTNKGILRMGETTYEQSFTLYGISDAVSGLHSCQGGEEHNETITATLIDEDMHPCDGHNPDWFNSDSDSPSV